jgi:hypothetical protein
LSGGLASYLWSGFATCQQGHGHQCRQAGDESGADTHDASLWGYIPLKGINIFEYDDYRSVKSISFKKIRSAVNTVKAKK